MTVRLIEQFLETARQELQPYLNEIGLVIYSSIDTLAPNPIAFWGFNPGQSPKVHDPTHWTIEEALTRFRTQTESLLMQVWPNAKAGTRIRAGREEYRQKFKAGDAPYQRGTRYLLSRVCSSVDGIALPAPLVSNFLLLQTKSQSEADSIGNIADAVRRCWRVHEAIFTITKPEVLITTAKVLAYVRKFELMRLSPTNDCIRSGYSNWVCRKWEAGCKHGEMIVLQVPHMSYWGSCIEKERSREAVAWVVKAVQAALSRS